MARPMLVKEEKILLMAKEGGELGEKLLAIKQVVNNCCQDIDNINDLAVFDIEYLFLKIRAISVDNIVKISYVDDEDSEEREFEIDLNTVEIDFGEKKDNIIHMGKDSGLTLRYPTSSLFDVTKNVDDDDKFMDMLVVNSLVNYFSGEQVYDMSKETKENIENFIDENINTATYYKIREFLASVPTLRHVIKYTNNNGNKREIELNTLNDFFTF